MSNDYNHNAAPPPPYSPPPPGFVAAYAPQQAPQVAYVSYPPNNQPYTQQVYQPQRSGQQVVVVTQVAGGGVVYGQGSCPRCRVGNPENHWPTLCGVCCAFWFFPIGLICCIAMHDTRCSHCGAYL